MTMADTMADTLTTSNSPASSSSSSPRLMLTKRSVKDLLAELSDSDSESELGKSTLTKPTKARSTVVEQDESSDDEVVLGAGRLAARLAGNKSIPAQSIAENTAETLAVTHNSGSEDELVQDPPANTSIPSETVDFIPKRRLLLKRKRSDEDEIQSPPNESDARRRDGSPTPTRSNHSSSPAAKSPAAPAANAAAKSKFELLIEKARNERLAREAAEKAKKAARAAERSSASPKRKIQRGSSPADDTEEDSDRSESGPSKKLTQAARPARKASKKALEEMNRETQRMNRNMQLAHQATTKKKFTKQSFFQTFNRNPTMNSSSAPSSDNESPQLHSTPPTSPLLEPETPKNSTTNMVTHPVELEQDEDFEDAPDLMAIIAQKNREAELQQLKAAQALEHPVVNPDYDSDSGSDIEVVVDKASKRKYVAFENLPKRKAQELPSHLVLRALAHVKKHTDKKSSMTTADMGPALLRAARNQALEERKAKIEKLKAAGVVIQTAEEREMEEEELEDLVEKARQEDEEIRKREKELAKKEGTYVKDALDEEDSDEDDDDFVGDDEANSGSEDEADNEGGNATDGDDEGETDLIDGVAEGSDEEVASEIDSSHHEESDVESGLTRTPLPSRGGRKQRIVLDDEEDEEPQTRNSPVVPPMPKTPHSILRSVRKVIPGLEPASSLPMGLTQAFAATMADSQTQEDEDLQEQDSMDVLRELPSPQVAMIPHLHRLDSIDMVSESVPNSQTQPLDLDLGFSQSQRVPESPAMAYAPTQLTFDLTQDQGYVFSPYKGDRFAETPIKQPHSTEDTVIIDRADESPAVARKGRLQRGRQGDHDSGDENEENNTESAFSVMKRAAKRKLQQDFNKKRSEARGAVDEAAEESDDEYAGLGGASDDESGEENEDDRKMIDEDTQVGLGDEAKLAKLHADRERESDEAAVSKLLKDITTGGLRRKRGAGDDLDLSDEEDAVARRREAKRREFAKMRRELLKDEAVNKIADDQKKQAFLKSIEDHDDDDEADVDDFDRPETQPEADSQESSQNPAPGNDMDTDRGNESSQRALQPKKDSQLNISANDHRSAKVVANRKPANLAEIRDSLSFLIEEPESQTGIVDLGLSDSEDEPEAYVNLDRHFQQAEADEEAMMDENEDLGDFIVADAMGEEDLDDFAFKKPELPVRDGDRAPFSERRTKTSSVVDRLSMIRQSSSSTGANSSNKMAFMSGKGANGNASSVPSLLRRATTNSGLGSMSGRENVSATGVVTNKTERGSAASEKDFVRKGANTSRNAINYQGRQNLKEEKMSARAGVVKKQQQKKKGGSFLTGLFRGDTWG